MLSGESAFHGVEGIADGDVGVLVGLMSFRVAADDQLAPWHRQIEANMVKSALVQMAVEGARSSHGNP
jgi:hypothetical protein